MDSQLVLIKKRVKTVSRRFLFLNITVLVCLFCIIFPCELYDKKAGDIVVGTFEQVPLEILTAGFLAASAYFIGRFVRLSTN